MARPHSLRGLEIREGQHTLSVRFRFIWQGEPCSHTVRFAGTRARTIAEAARLKAAVDESINRRTFDPERLLPGSKIAARFRTGSSLTVGKLLRDYLEIVRTKRAADTYKGYKGSVERHILPRWEHTPVAQLTRKDIRTWIASFATKKKTISEMLIPLRRALAEALEDELIESNPFSQIQLKNLVSEEQSESDFECNPFRFHEIRALHAACETPEERALLANGFGTGMRPLEVMALQWPQIDLQTMKLYVQKKRSGRRTSKRLKTPKSVRAIDIRTGVLEALLELYELPTRHERYVFIDPLTGEPWRSTDRLRQWFKLLCKRAGVVYRNPYQMRHTFASTLLAMGEPSLYVVAQMGHTSLKMIEERYGRWIDQGRSDEARLKIDAFYTLAVKSLHDNPALQSRVRRIVSGNAHNVALQGPH